MYTHILNLEVKDGGDIEILEMKMKQRKHPAILGKNPMLFLHCGMETNRCIPQGYHLVYTR